MKYSILLVVLSLMSVSKSMGETEEQLLQRADSLFDQKKYTESYEIYQELFTQQELYSPGMLLKMAFIREGLGDYTHALYFLNLYYRQTASKAALRKMEDLADEHNLDGYEFNDIEFFLSIYHRHFSTIIYFLLAFALLWFAYMVYLRRRKNRKPIGWAVGFFIIMLGIVYLINFGDRYRKAIINNTDSFLMEDPSSAANLVEVIGKGHRVVVIGK
ncbi:MAG: hypothetical protein ACOCXH_15195, partial [Cyclobacteriaceae bacterium]